jgi:hypothetical protein
MERISSDPISPKSKLQLTVDKTFFNPRMYGANMLPNTTAISEALTLHHAHNKILMVRAFDEARIPRAYAVFTRDTADLSYATAGLVWRPEEELPPRIIDRHIDVDTSYAVAGQLALWLDACVQRTPAKQLPPHPFKDIYEGQEATVETLGDGPLPEVYKTDIIHAVAGALGIEPGSANI